MGLSTYMGVMVRSLQTFGHMVNWERFPGLNTGKTPSWKPFFQPELWPSQLRLYDELIFSIFSQTAACLFSFQLYLINGSIKDLLTEFYCRNVTLYTIRKWQTNNLSEVGSVYINICLVCKKNFSEAFCLICSHLNNRRNNIKLSYGKQQSAFS